MAEKRHHEHKRPKVTTTQQDGMLPCICSNRIPGAKMSSCRCEAEGVGSKETVRREGHRGTGRVPSGTGGASAVRQQPHDPHQGDEQPQRLSDMPSHFNAAAPPASIQGNNTEARVSSHVNSNPTLGDALLPYIARNTLLAKLAPFFASSIINSSHTEKMEVAVIEKKHRSGVKSKHTSEESPRRHRHHSHHSHKSDGELEIERVKAKVRGDDRLKEREVNSSSDRGKAERKHRRRERSSLSPVDKPKREETDLEKEERRRRRRERRLEVELKKEESTTERRRESKSPRKERRDRGNESDRPRLSPDRP
ncbi:hypothetical protein DFH27DRAFT_115625 [Peziza echinospora]|nr:hypothetical protein DFH27DRAFT_139423 [Peziza echinospora]KAI5795300.1 hypothetical protein DFH27DRAFT_115625 [Peziza echinospora]